MSDSELSGKSMISQEDAAVLSRGVVPWFKHLVVSILLLLGTLGILVIMFANSPEARKFGQRPSPSVAVETMALKPTSYEVWIESYGTVQPMTQTRLVSDVSGRVIWVSENIRAGSSFNEGEVLVRLDERDFNIEVDVALAAVADAEVKYQQELAQADIAERDWNVRPGNAKARELALRKPQVAAALASLEAAKAKLAKAQLNLERTQVKAPFAGKVRQQFVDLGQVVSPTQAIAEIYSTALAEVRLPVKANDLAYLSIPEGEQDQPKPKVVFESELGRQQVVRVGKIVRSEGAFDASTRMLYLVAEIEQPFTTEGQQRALRAGQFVQAKIQGETLVDVFVLPRRGVSQDNMVSIAEEETLIKKRITPLWTDNDNVIVSATDHSGGEKRVLSESDVFILTPTANLPSGTRIRSMNATKAVEAANLIGKSSEKQTTNSENAGKKSEFGKPPQSSIEVRRATTSEKSES